MSRSIKFSIIQKLFVGIVIGWTVLIILFIAVGISKYQNTDNSTFSSNIEFSNKR